MAAGAGWTCHGCGRLRLYKVNELPIYGNSVWTGGASLRLPLKSGYIVQHGESPRKSEELLETAVTGKRHRRNAKNFKTPKKSEELLEKLVKHRRNGQGHRYFLETRNPAKKLCSIYEYAQKCLKNTPDYDEELYKKDRKQEILRMLK